MIERRQPGIDYARTGTVRAGLRGISIWAGVAAGLALCGFGALALVGGFVMSFVACWAWAVAVWCGAGLAFGLAYLVMAEVDKRAVRDSGVGVVVKRG